MARASSVRVVIVGDTRPFQRSLQRASKLGSQFGKAIGLGLAAVGAGAAAAGAAGAKMALDFEAAMGEVKTLLPQLSEQGFGRLQQDVLAFSKEMGIATGEAVPALYQAISAGVPPDNVIDFMRTATEASIGGVTDLETAVDGITSVVNAYGEEAISASKASDLMFTAVKLGKTDFTQLSGSLFNVIPTAASLGVEFESVAASLAAMTAQGIPTNVATTQLRQLFVEASKSGTKLDKALRDMTGKGFAGLVASGADGIDVLNDLRASMPDQAFRDLFGSVEASNAALALTGPNASAVQAAMAEMQGSAGATNQAFQTVADTTRFQLGKAWNEVKVSLTEVGGQLLPHLASFLKSVVVPAIQAFSDRLPQIGRAAGTVFAGIKTVWENVLRPVFGALRDAAGTVKDWIVANWPAISHAFKRVWAAIRQLWGNILKPVLDALWDAVGAVKDWLVGNWPTISKVFKRTWGEIKQLWASVLKPVLDLVWAALTGVWQLVRKHWPQIKQVVKAVFEGIQTAWESGLQPALEGAVNVLREVVRWVKEHFRDLLPLVAALTTTAAAYYTYTGALKATALAKKGITNATKAYAAAMKVLNTVMKANPIFLIVSLLAVLGSALVTAWMTSETFREKVRAVWDGVKEAVETFVGFFTETVPKTFRRVYNKAREIFAQVKDAIVGAFQTVVGWLREHWPEIVTVLAGPFGGPFVAIATDAFGVRTKLVEAFQYVLTKAGEIFGGVKDKIVEIFTSVKDWIVGFGTDIYQGAKSLGTRILDGIVDGIKNLGAKLVEFLLAPINKAIGLVNRIKLPSFSFSTPEFGIAGVTIVPSETFTFPAIDPIPHIAPLKMAAGGIVTRPTLAMVGEAGPEAVIPLGRGRAARPTPPVVNLTVNIQGPVTGTRDLALELREELVRIGRENPSLFGGYA